VIALLMCGGRGMRLNRGEKPLFRVCGSRLIEHSLEELKDQDVIAVTSPYTPKTEYFLKEKDIAVYRASGSGFIEDYVEACVNLSIHEPVLIVSSDIVYIRRGLINRIVDAYFKSNTRALKVVRDENPAGINIIDAFFIDDEQDEEIYNIGENDAVNINTLEDVKRAEKLWMLRKRKEKDSLKG
jgi:adenosylcobinamide-phosphate guanylyltransferase